MVAAGFDRAFIGIEAPDEDCLAECSEHQNENRDLVEDTGLLQRAGLEVQGGAISSGSAADETGTPTQPA